MEEEILVLLRKRFIEKRFVIVLRCDQENRIQISFSTQKQMEICENAFEAKFEETKQIIFAESSVGLYKFGCFRTRLGSL